MERKVSISKKVNDTLEKLVDALFDKDYFNNIDDAVSYVNKISDFIYTIPTKGYRVSPKDINGMFYITYKPNKHTTWYISFTIENDFFYKKHYQQPLGRLPNFYCKFVKNKLFVLKLQCANIKHH